jgi:hypothetical protein
LMGLLIPAVNSVRESSRLMQCRGNLRQLAQACTNYANASGVMPAEGASGRFGIPDFSGIGVGGGWLFRILPFVEQQSLFDLGTGLTGASQDAAVRSRVGTPVSLFTCSTRGPALFTAPPVMSGISYTIPTSNTSANANRAINPGPPSLARSDYAGSGGFSQYGLTEGVFGRNAWSDSARMLEEIKDGLSNVFLCGERYLPPDEYRPEQPSSPLTWVTGRRNCNDRGWSVGAKGDVYAAAVDGSTLQPPLPDTAGVPNCTVITRVGRFGSPHSGVPMAMVDGSVRMVSFNVSPGLFGSLCVIDDNAGSIDQLK